MSNLIKAIERAEEELGESLSYYTDDNSKVTQIFVWKAPGLKLYTQSMDQRRSIAVLTTEIVEHFKRHLKPPPNYDYTSTQRSHKRREKLNEIATGLGYESWNRLVTDVINGKAEVVRINPTAIII